MLARTSRALVLLAGLALPAAARANGAFPDTSQVLLPPDLPDTIVVGTNFGLVITEDGGKHWRWTCEHDAGLGGTLYQLAPLRGQRLIAVGQDGLAASNDLACTWQSPSPPDPFVYDAFPDPGARDRILAVAERVIDGHEYSLISESTDGGLTLGKTLYMAPTGLEITTLEVARADPRFIYATLFSLDGHGPSRVARSSDGGATWTLAQPAGAPDGQELWIAAVDGADARKVYFRVLTGNPDDALAVTADGADSLTIPLTARGSLTSFVRLDDGTLLAGAQRMADGQVYRSTDGGQTFVPLATTIRPRALAERDGKLYAATDDALDGYALAVSSDRGDSWKRVMAFSDIGSISACGLLPAACSDACAMLLAKGIVTPHVCDPSVPLPPPPGGKHGCAYRAGAGGTGGALVLAALGLLALRRRRPW